MLEKERKAVKCVKYCIHKSLCEVTFLSKNHFIVYGT